METIISLMQKTKKQKKVHSNHHYQLYLFCLIPCLLVFVFNYLPMIGLILPFKQYRYDKGIFGSEWIGLNNFKSFIGTNDFFNITYNTLFLNTIFIVVGMIAAICTAFLLYSIINRNLTKIFQTILITPHFLSWVIAGYMAYAILSPVNGILNEIISMLGYESIDWYSKPEAWPAILSIASVWKHVGMDSVIYYAALMGISSELYEAASIDGAGWLKKAWHISLPGIKQLIIILTILKIGGIFRADFGLFYQVTRDVGVLYSTTDVLDTYIFRTLRVLGNVGISSAVGFLQSVVGFTLVIITNYVAKKVDEDSGLF